jgi:hypothetical protein
MQSYNVRPRVGGGPRGAGHSTPARCPPDPGVWCCHAAPRYSTSTSISISPARPGLAVSLHNAGPRCPSRASLILIVHRSAVERGGHVRAVRAGKLPQLCILRRRAGGMRAGYWGGGVGGWGWGWRVLMRWLGSTQCVDGGMFGPHGNASAACPTYHAAVCWGMAPNHTIASVALLIPKPHMQHPGELCP